MKKVLLLLTAIILLAACTGTPQETAYTQEDAPVQEEEYVQEEPIQAEAYTQEAPVQAEEHIQEEASEDKPIIFTSFHAMHDFTRTIAGDALTVEVLLPLGASAHHWEPSAQDMVRLTEAAAFIYHGAGMEHFTDSLRASLDGELIFIEASAHVEPSLTHADPHLWLNPLYAIRIKETIKDALIEIYPDSADIFESNFQAVSQQLLALDEAFKEAAADFIRRDIVVSHAAFGHLSHTYGLNQVPIEGGHSHTDPSPSHMAEIITFVNENGVTTIFYDKDPSLAEAVARETNTRTVMLDTFEGINDNDYFTVMRRNLEVLIEALS